MIAVAYLGPHSRTAGKKKIIPQQHLKLVGFLFLYLCLPSAPVNPAKASGTLGTFRFDVHRIARLLV